MRSDPVLGVSEEALAATCARYRVRELAIFGSAARGELKADSDVDLLVVFEKDARIGLFTFVRLQHELAELFGRDVDLVTRDGLKPGLESEVLAEAQTLFPACPGGSSG